MKIIAHRGAMGLAPENTITAIQKGLQHQADILELDVRVTKDNIPVLHHDSFLEDGNGARVNIADHTFSQLRIHKPDLATLEEALEFIDTKATVNIEIKKSCQTAPIIAMTRQFIGGMYSSKDILFSSFDQQMLVEMHDALPNVPTMVLESWSGYCARRRANQLNTRLLCMNQRWLWWGFIVPIARGGWKLSAYTLNNPKKAKRWAKWGLYGAVTDYPDLFDYHKGS